MSARQLPNSYSGTHSTLAHYILHYPTFSCVSDGDEFTELASQCPATFSGPTAVFMAWKNGGPASEPTLESSVVLLIKGMVASLRDLACMSFCIIEAEPRMTLERAAPFVSAREVA